MKVNAVVFSIDSETKKGELIATGPDGKTSKSVPLTKEGTALVMASMLSLLQILYATPGTTDQEELLRRAGLSEAVS